MLSSFSSSLSLSSSSSFAAAVAAAAPRCFVVHRRVKFRPTASLVRIVSNYYLLKVYINLSRVIQPSPRNSILSLPLSLSPPRSISLSLSPLSSTFIFSLFSFLFSSTFFFLSSSLPSFSLSLSFDAVFLPLNFGVNSESGYRG